MENMGNFNDETRRPSEVGQYNIINKDALDLCSADRGHQYQAQGRIHLSQKSCELLKCGHWKNYAIFMDLPQEIRTFSSIYGWITYSFWHTVAWLK